MASKTLRLERYNRYQQGLNAKNRKILNAKNRKIW